MEFTFHYTLNLSALKDQSKSEWEMYGLEHAILDFHRKICKRLAGNARRLLYTHNQITKIIKRRKQESS